MTAQVWPGPPGKDDGPLVAKEVLVGGGGLGARSSLPEEEREEKGGLHWSGSLLRVRAEVGLGIAESEPSLFDRRS